MKTQSRRQISWNAVTNLIGLALLLVALIPASPALAGAQEARPLPGQAPTVSQPDLRLLSSTAQGLIVEFQAPDFTLETATVNGVTCQYPRIAGYGFSDLVGGPLLPVRGGMVGLPPQAQPRLTVLTSETAVVAKGVSLCPVQAPFEENAAYSELPPAPTGNQAAILQAPIWPEKAVELTGLGMIRDQSVAEFRLYPFQYKSRTGELLAIKRLTFRLEYGAPQVSIHPKASQELHPDFENYLAATLLNYAEAQSWRLTPETPVLLRSNSVQGALPPSYKIAVSQEGIYQVTYEDLATVAGAELPASLPAQALHLTVGGDLYHGREIAIEVLDGGDGAFNTGDAFLFYGQPVDTKYAGTNIYYLSWNDQPGKRMPQQDSAPSGQDAGVIFRNKRHLEQNLKYLTNYPSGSAKDVWYWDYVQANGSKSFTFTLPTVANDPTRSIHLSGLLRGYSGIPQHHTRIYLNNNLVDDAFWGNNTTYAFSKELPQSVLVAGVNTIKVEALLDNGITSNLVLINWFEIEYWDILRTTTDALAFRLEAGSAANPEIADFTSSSLELFDLSNPEIPLRLINFQVASTPSGYSLIFGADNSNPHSYWAQTTAKRLRPAWIARDQITSWRSTEQAADYIIITHRDFLAAAQRLADYRTGQGLRTQVIDVEDIYDEFSGGLITPLAIRDFLAYAYTSWQPPAPLFVVLMGDGHYDPRNYLGNSGPFYIPPYLEFVDYYMGETASDNRFVTVSGDDNLPDLFIGRLPVNTPQQADTTVNKILAYEQNPAATGWNTRLLFVADNPDAAGDFPYYSDKTANGFAPAMYTVEKIYYGSTHTDVNAARAAILNALNNQGALILNYVGHGSTRAWATENLFTYNSLAALNNADKLPFVASLSCLVGAFHYPKFSSTDTTSLAEGLVVYNSHGAIASFASTGMGLASGQDYLDQGLFNSIFKENQTLLGAAVTRAKLYLYANTGGAYPDLVDIFTLFGDPATRLNVIPQKKATLGDRVWADLNRNGLQEAGEPGLAGVAVTLYRADGRPVASTVTDLQGNYIFSEVDPGASYYLAFTPPTGFQFSPIITGFTDLNSDADPATGKTGLVSLQEGDENLNLDAGLFKLAAVGNRVWEDMNANGLQEPEEPGVAGVPVQLFAADGALVASTVTDPQGYYRFEGLLPGDYFLRFGLIGNYRFSPQFASDDPALDSEADPTTGQSAVFTLLSGSYDDSHDAGVFRLAAVGDRVWWDKNKNGIQDRTESGVGGVKIALYTAEGVLVARTSTDRDGYFLFTDLLPGRYYLVFCLPRGYSEFTILNPQAGAEYDSNVINAAGETAVFVLVSGQTDLSWDAGLVKGALK